MWIDRITAMNMATLRITSLKSFLTLMTQSTLRFMQFVLLTVTRFEQKDEEYGEYPDNIMIEDMGDNCMGGGSYVGKNGKLSSAYEAIEQ